MSAPDTKVPPAADPEMGAAELFLTAYASNPFFPFDTVVRAREALDELREKYGALRSARTLIVDLGARCEAAEADRDRLAKALQGMMAWCPGDPNPECDAARAALRETEASHD